MYRYPTAQLYVCMDLGKVDEAVQSLHTLVTFKTSRNTMKDIPDVDPKVVRSLVYTAIVQLKEAREGEMAEGESAETRAALVTSKERTLVRVGELLGRISSALKTAPWVWELYVFYYESLGKPRELVIETCMKHHRSLMAKWGDGGDEEIVRAACMATCKVAGMYLESEEVQDKSRARMLVNGFMKKVERAWEFRGGEEGYTDEIKAVVDMSKKVL